MGDESPHDDDVIDTNGRLEPTKSAFIKVAFRINDLTAFHFYLFGYFIVCRLRRHGS